MFSFGPRIGEGGGGREGRGLLMNDGRVREDRLALDLVRVVALSIARVLVSAGELPLEGDARVVGVRGRLIVARDTRRLRVEGLPTERSRELDLRRIAVSGVATLRRLTGRV